jgi:hypothetical protein
MKEPISSAHPEKSERAIQMSPIIDGNVHHI